MWRSQHAEKFHLHGHRKLALSVEEERAAPASSNTPARIDRTGEGSLICPKRMDSMRFSGMAPQLMATKGLSLRGPWL